MKSILGRNYYRKLSEQDLIYSCLDHDNEALHELSERVWDICYSIISTKLRFSRGSLWQCDRIFRKSIEDIRFMPAVPSLTPIQTFVSHFLDIARDDYINNRRAREYYYENQKVLSVTTDYFSRIFCVPQNHEIADYCLFGGYEFYQWCLSHPSLSSLSERTKLAILHYFYKVDLRALALKEKQLLTLVTNVVIKERKDWDFYQNTPVIPPITEVLNQPSKDGQ